MLVFIDGSQYGISCSRFVAWIASCIDIEIEVVYVTDLRQFEVLFVADLSGSLGLLPFQAFDHRELDYGNASRVPSTVYSVSLGFRGRPQLFSRRLY